MNKQEFESKAIALITAHPDGYEDERWRIKFDVDEYLVKWNNGGNGARRKEFRSYFSQGTFTHH